jgi:hypothetical protein
MTRRQKAWFVVFAIFTAINLAGMGFAVAAQEWMHTMAHVALTVVGAIAMARLARPAPAQQGSTSLEAQERLQDLQRSVDAVALEVERIGEAQRYIAKKAAERAERSPPTDPSK